MSENIITLNQQNSIEFLIKYIELCQDKGVFNLQEADIIKKSISVLTGVTDPQINKVTALNILVQGVQKGQLKGGCFKLNDASLLFNIIQYINNNPQLFTDSLELQQQSPNTNITASIEKEQNQLDHDDDDDDLSELSAPVPLIKKTPKII